ARPERGRRAGLIRRPTAAVGGRRRPWPRGRDPDRPGPHRRAIPAIPFGVARSAVVRRGGTWSGRRYRPPRNGRRRRPDGPSIFMPPDLRPRASAGASAAGRPLGSGPPVAQNGRTTTSGVDEDRTTAGELARDDQGCHGDR